MENNTLLANVPVDLLYQALETEKGGVHVYTTALRLALNKDLKEEWIVTAADEISRTGTLEFRPGLVATRDAYAQSLGDEFVNAIAKHRHWERERAL